LIYLSPTITHYSHLEINWEDVSLVVPTLVVRLTFHMLDNYWLWLSGLHWGN